MLSDGASSYIVEGQAATTSIRTITWAGAYMERGLGWLVCASVLRGRENLQWVSKWKHVLLLGWTYVIDSSLVEHLLLESTPAVIGA